MFIYFLPRLPNSYYYQIDYISVRMIYHSNLMTTKVEAVNIATNNNSRIVLFQNIPTLIPL